MNKWILIVVCGLLQLSQLVGQTDVTIHTDKPYYVTGEVVWYKIYLPAEFRNASGKVKVVVQNNHSETIDQSYAQLENAAVAGYYRIPFDINSDLYHFSLYVIDNNSLRPARLVTWEVPIYNDLREDGFQAIFPNANGRGIQPVSSTNNSSLELNIDHSNQEVGAAMDISVAVKDGNGEIIPSDISIAVIDHDIIGSNPAVNCVFRKPLEIGRTVQVGLDERIFVQGEITDAITGEPARINVMGAFDPDQNKMHYAKSDNEGQFTLLMKDQIGPGQLQITGYLYEEYSDTKIQLHMGDDINSNLAMTSEYDVDIASYIEKSNVRKRIYQHFNQLESDIKVADYAKEKSIVRPNKSFKVKEYVTFETVGNFFDEILGSQLNFLKNKGEVTARMYDPESNKNVQRDDDEYYFPRSPIFIVNGKMTKDAGYIYNMKLGGVEQIDLYYDWRDITKQFGTFGDFGYVVIYTSQADISLPAGDADDIVSYNGLQPIVEYPINIDNDDRSFPKLKPLVYWQPRLQVNSTGSSIVQYHTSDDASTFSVIVVARTEDGEVLTSSGNYHTVIAN